MRFRYPGGGGVNLDRAARPQQDDSGGDDPGITEGQTEPLEQPVGRARQGGQQAGTRPGGGQQRPGRGRPAAVPAKLDR